MRKIFFIFLIFGFLFSGCQHKSKIALLFPKSFLNLKLVKLIQNRPAMEMINKLHGKAIRVKNAWIAYYKDPQQNRIIIWVSEAFSTYQAQKQTQIMIDKILKNKGPFYDFQKIKIHNNLVYLFSGMGQKHAVFCKNTLVFWISSPSYLIKDLINYYLKF